MIYLQILKFILLFFIFFEGKSWKVTNSLSNFASMLNRTDWRDEYIKKTTINNAQFLIIYGGRTQQIIIAFQNTKFTSNSLYRINLQTFETKQLAINKILRPSNHYSVCGNIIRDRLLIYGGYTEEGKLTNQLWQYDFMTDEWSFRGTSLFFSKCSIEAISNVYSNDTIAVYGTLNENNTFKIIQYSIFSHIFKQDITLFNYNSIGLNSTLWDGTVQQTYLRIKNQQILSNKTNFGARVQIQFPVKYFCTVFSTTNTYIFITNNGIYRVSRIGSYYQMRFIYQNNDQNFERIKCQSIQDWYLIIKSLPISKYTKKSKIYIQFISLKTLSNKQLYKNKKKNLHVQQFDQIQFFSIFAYQNSVFIVNQKLQVLYLNKTCDLSMQDKDKILICVFSMFSCIEGYTGPNCSLKQCPGSLRFYDSNNLTIIDIECQGNGVCQGNGCKCYDNWTGQNCQIYIKKNCKGSLIQNFIASNCQCNQATIGGNTCEVIFCYNDCSGKGKCQYNGQCLCEQNYTGPDCSILMISFDLV